MSIPVNLVAAEAVDFSVFLLSCSQCTVLVSVRLETVNQLEENNIQQNGDAWCNLRIYSLDNFCDKYKLKFWVILCFQTILQFC